MPDLSTLALFAVACLALTATPGPDMLLIASRSATQGRAAGFASLADIAQVSLGREITERIEAHGLASRRYFAWRWMSSGRLRWPARCKPTSRHSTSSRRT
jgi:hypothetical protein